jgi:light-regulated signal transduction histidine kinase (bacteriophytochrome)
LFQNLMSNAIKFRTKDNPVIHIRAKEEDSHWLFTIKDNGIGIPTEYADRVFVIFQRLHTRQKYPGTGIGLAVCKKIVERHGGKVWLEQNADGPGTTFFFTIQKA